MPFLSDSALERLRAAADSPDLTGTRYRLVEKLGQGGMGGVYCVEDTELQRNVALKVISVPDPDGARTARLLQEARIIARLEHPGIIPVHDVGTLADGRPFYTMKLVRGKRLDEHIASIPGISDRLRIFSRICDAVAFAHAHNVLHRDLKPSNVMIGPFGEVLVMDWGLSKWMKPGEANGEANRPILAASSDTGAKTLTGHGSIVGTPGYMAPEQAQAGGPVDARADIYSLGAILKFLIAGDTREIAKPLSAIRDRAIAELPENRYQTVIELAGDVAHFLDGLPVSAYPEGPIARCWGWIRRNRTWILLLLAYVVTRALLIFFRPR